MSVVARVDNARALAVARICAAVRRLCRTKRHGSASRPREGRPALSGFALALALLLAASLPSGGKAQGSPDGEEAARSAEAAEAARDEPSEEARRREETAQLCALLLSAAGAHEVPPDFFIRLIWKESRFDPNAVSPVGAQGIAQFMPGTARIRGLKNPFDVEEALFASASFLADLHARFGSWGLAAAGYNGGPNRVPRFVEGVGGMPYETRDYVFSITGRTVEYWAERARRAAGPPATDAAAGEDEALPDRGGAGDGESAEAPPGQREPAASRGEGKAAGHGGGRAPAEVADAEPRRAPSAVLSVSAPADGGGLAVVPETASAVTTAVAAVASALTPVPSPRPDYWAGAVDCPRLVARLGTARSVPMPGTRGGWTVWGAQVAGHPKRHIALRQYARLKDRLPGDLVASGPTIVVRRFAARGRLPIHAVMFPASGREEARGLCKRISAARAPCVVVRNR